MRRTSVDIPVLLLVALVLDLQLFARLVKHVLQALIHGRFAILVPGTLAKLRIVPPGILLHDLFKPFPRIGAVVLVIVLTVTLPRFLASNASMCVVLGASWTTTTTGVDACVFYQR